MNSPQNRKAHLKEAINDWSLDHKLDYSFKRIDEFIDYVFANQDKIFTPRMLKKHSKDLVISFSGGKDSTVLAILVNRVYQIRKKEFLKHKISLFLGNAQELNYPESTLFINQFAKNINLPLQKRASKIPLNILWNKIGYPIASKETSGRIYEIRNMCGTKNIAKAFGFQFHIPKTCPRVARKWLHFLDKDLCPFELTKSCCDKIKGGWKHDKRPAFVGTTTSESSIRKLNWIKKGCNVLDDKNKLRSRPLSIWTEKDIWNFIKLNKIKYNPIYDKGETRQGCVSCGFGAQFEKEKLNRYERLKNNNLGLYNYQIWTTGFWKPLCFAGIKIRNDAKYMEHFQEIQVKVKNWHNNLKTNLYKVLNDINKRRLTGKCVNKKHAYPLSQEEIDLIVKSYTEKRVIWNF